MFGKLIMAAMMAVAAGTVYAQQRNDKSGAPTPVLPQNPLDSAATAAEPKAAQPAARPDLGIKIAELPLLLRSHLVSLLGHERGVLVVEVPPTSLGAASGLKAGDILITLNGWPIAVSTKWDELYARENLLGSRLGILRAGRLETLLVPAPVIQPTELTGNLAISATAINGRVSVFVSGRDAQGQPYEWKFDGTRPELEPALKQVQAGLAQQIRDAVDGRTTLPRPFSEFPPPMTVPAVQKNK